MSPFLSFFLSGLFFASLSAQPLFGVAQTRVRLSEGPNAQRRVQIGLGDLVELTDRGPKSSVSQDGATVSAEPNQVLVQAITQPVLLEAQSMERWTMEIPKDSAAAVHVDFEESTVSLSAPAGNSDGLLLRFSDQGKLTMLPDSSARLEFLSDGTYSVRASTNVVGTTADGMKVQFSDLNPLMAGGDLQQAPGPGGQSRFVRTSPMVTVELLGSPDRQVRVLASGTAVTLAPNEDRQITFKNGSAVMLQQNSARQTVDWRVLRGVCQFNVDGFTCWKGIATTGQSGSIQWNTSRKIIDFSNRSKEVLMVQLSGRVTASITPGATFQYAQLQDCGSFVSSAAGGEVLLYNRDTEDIARVQEQNVLYSEGERVGAQRAERHWTAVGLRWDSESRVQLNSAGINLAVVAGGEQSFRSADQGLRASYLPNGLFSIRAEKGDYAINPEFIPELSMQVPEGGAVVMRLSRPSAFFTAQAAEDSATSIRVLAGGKTYMFLSGSARITVNLGQNALIPESNTAWIFFEGAGGESTFTSGIHPGPLIVPDRLDVSRIIQEPVSVLE